MINSSKDLIQAVRDKAEQEDSVESLKSEILQYVVENNISHFYTINWSALNREANVPEPRYRRTNK